MNSTPDIGDNQLVALWVRACTVIALAVIAAVTSCTMSRDYRQGEALKAGADPVGVSCVYSASTDCALAAAKGKP